MLYCLYYRSLVPSTCFADSISTSLVTPVMRSLQYSLGILPKCDALIPRVVRSTRMSTGSFPKLPFSDARSDLLLALTSQAAIQSQRAIESVVSEGSKYVFPRRDGSSHLEEAFMSVPDLETIPYRVIRKEANYEIRETESYMIAETNMPGGSGFDFFVSGQSFNTLADYLFGKNKKREAMEMTTPVVTQRTRAAQSEKMDMTTPVLTQKGSGEDKWRMAFVLPSKYDESNLPIPDNASVKLRRVPSKTVAVVAFPGYVTDDLVKRKEQILRRALEKDSEVRIKSSAQAEVAQYNPPFTPPFMRRNEISLEVE